MRHDEIPTPIWPEIPELKPQLSPEVVRMIRNLPPEKQAEVQTACEVQSIGDQRFMWLLRESAKTRECLREHEQVHHDTELDAKANKRRGKGLAVWIAQLILTSVAAAAALWLFKVL
jgi:hypothetical protein